jgi:hypothetical protein
MEKAELMFTDDHLNDLKACLAKPGSVITWDAIGIEALVHRLSAAERALGQALELEKLVCEFADKECSNAVGEQMEHFDGAVSIWQNASGKRVEGER